MGIRRTWSTAAFSLLLSCPALAQNPPTDVDLKTAYCIGVLEHRIATMEDFAKRNKEIEKYSEEMLRQPRSDLHRLRNYLLPRAPKLDLDGVVAAKNRGAIDRQASVRQTEFCLDRCPLAAKAGSPAVDKWNQCLASCGSQEPAVAREDSCKNVNWLPF